MADVIKIFRASNLSTLDEVEEVLMRKSQTVGLGARWNVRLKPYEIIPKNPPPLLHGDCEARWYEEELFLLSVLPHWRSSSLSRVIA